MRKDSLQEAMVARFKGSLDPTASVSADLSLSNGTQVMFTNGRFCGACRLGDPEGVVCVQSDGFINRNRFKLRKPGIFGTGLGITIRGDAVEEPTPIGQCPAFLAYLEFRQRVEEVNKE